MLDPVRRVVNEEAIQTCCLGKCPLKQGFDLGNSAGERLMENEAGVIWIVATEIAGIFYIWIYRLSNSLNLAGKRQMSLTSQKRTQQKKSS